MRSLIAFLKKEAMEQFRNGKFMFLGILFVLLGIMNPAVAKLTPWLLETLADSLVESGMIVTSVTVSAMDSWMQFFKNLPMALIAFVLLQSSIFTKECQTGTLVLSLTKGLARYKVVISKTVVLAGSWTVGFWLCFGITYGYNAYFWNNSVAQNLMFSVICWWLFGIWVIALMILFSALTNANTGVLIGTGGVVLASYLLGLFPQLSKYLPTLLADGTSLIYGVAEATAYSTSLIVAAVISLVSLTGGVMIFNKKQL